MIEELKPYEALRPSGDPWLGEIPKHWSQKRLWSISSPRVERNPGNLPLLSVFLDRGVIPYGEGGGQVHAPSLDLSNYQVVHPGDFVLNNQQAWRGSVGVSRHHGIISPAYIVLRLNCELLPAYANYLFRCPRLVDQFVAASKGVGDIQRQVFWPFLRRVIVPIPSAAEQEAIVRFLDHANRRIDQLVKSKRREMALLAEQKDVIVERAVTRGLQASKTEVRRGLEWLGPTPAGWSVTRIKYLLREVDERSRSGSETLLSVRMHHGIVPFAEHFNRPPQAASLVGFKVVRPGQLVINRMQAGNGVIFPSRLHGLVSPDYAVFEPLSSVNVDFLGELFRCRTVRTKFRSESKGLGTGTSGFLRLYNDRLGAIHVSLPDRSEQDRILAHLSVATRDIDRARGRLEREVGLISEYRARLVADVVTGQLDACAAAASLPAAVEPETAPTESEGDDDSDIEDGEAA